MWWSNVVHPLGLPLLDSPSYAVVVSLSFFVWCFRDGTFVRRRDGEGWVGGEAGVRLDRRDAWRLDRVSEMEEPLRCLVEKGRQAA